MDKIYLVMRDGKPLGWCASWEPAKEVLLCYQSPVDIVEIGRYAEDCSGNAHDIPEPDVFAEDISDPTEKAPDRPVFVVEHEHGVSEIVADAFRVYANVGVVFYNVMDSVACVHEDIAAFAPGTWTSVSRK